MHSPCGLRRDRERGTWSGERLGIGQALETFAQLGYIILLTFHPWLSRMEFDDEAASCVDGGERAADFYVESVHQ